MLRVFSPDSGRGQLLTELGFQPAPGVRDRFGDGFYFDVSAENMALVECDLLVVDNYKAPVGSSRHCRRSPRSMSSGRAV